MQQKDILNRDTESGFSLRQELSIYPDTHNVSWTAYHTASNVVDIISLKFSF